MGYYAETAGFGEFDQDVNARNLAASYYGHAFALFTTANGPAAAGVATKLTTAAELFRTGKYLPAARVAREAYESLAAGVGNPHAGPLSSAQRFGPGNRLLHCAQVQTPGCDRGPVRVKLTGAPPLNPEVAKLLRKFGIDSN